MVPCGDHKGHLHKAYYLAKCKHVELLQQKVVSNIKLKFKREKNRG
jgi:hypothetical protein